MRPKRSMASRIGFEALRADYNDRLLTAFETKTFDELLSHYHENKSSDYDKKAAVEQVFRDVLLKFLKNKDLDLLGNLVTFCIECAKAEMTGPTMPVVLLGDIFDALTLKNCESMFCYVEDNVATWKEEIFFIACKNNLLRMCNDLLRRLSRSQNTVFCGRILLFLAKFFPFSERSGLNIVSEFNLENVTELSTEDSDLSLKESLETDKDDDKKVKIDYNLYCKFWSLQEFFRNPNQCYNKVQWKVFTSHTTNVLSAFSSFKLDLLQTKQISKHVKKDEQMEVDDEIKKISSEDTHYYAKYLTNQKLLELQLSDSNFRRYVLVQFLILFQYLKSTVKFKSEGQVLSGPNIDWVNETWNQVLSLLGETPPDGKQFSSAVEHLMNREEAWNGWKNEGCPEFKKPTPVSLDTEDGDKKSKISEKVLNRAKRPRKLLGDILKESQAQGKFYMGHDDLTKLWNLCPDNMLSCKGKDRDFLPGLEYLENTGNDSNNEWRALRLAARKCPQFYTNSFNTTGKLSDFLNQIATSSNVEGKDSKQPLSPETNQTDETENFSEPIDSDFLKTENEAQMMEQPSTKPKVATPGQIDILSIKIASEWKKLATKLGYTSDEIEFFESENKTPAAAAKKMLQLWFEDDVDASLDNLAYTLEGLGMIDGAEVIKTFE